MDDYNYFDDNLSADDVQRIAADTTIRTLHTVAQSTAIAQQQKQAALVRAEEQHPGFLELYANGDVCKRFVEQRPRIAQAIANAESGQGSDALDELYGAFFDTARLLKSADYSVPQEPQPQSPSTEKPDALSPGSAARQRVIKEFEEKHGDLPIDLADDSDEAKRILRY